MPLTPKGKKILGAMEKEYGSKKGESVFYASRNKGTISGVEKAAKSKAIANRFATNPFAQKYRDTNEARERGREVGKLDKSNLSLRRK